MKTKDRSSGILIHISSLPGKYGIGDFGPESFKFVDFLARAGQKNWQILPLGMTGYGDSPYQCFSSFAGNPYFIDLDQLLTRGYLARSDMARLDLGSNIERVDYGLLYKNKLALLRLAYKRAYQELLGELEEFYQENKSWLREFALFMALKFDFNHKIWHKWPGQYRDYRSRAVEKYERENKEEVFFWVFSQYFFMDQWKRLKSYANSKNINIIGDLPIYVAEDSSDIWANPQLFKLDGNLQPRKLAGVPPDDFSDRGQLWGNPLYDWRAMEEENYAWWIKRLKFSLDQLDILRLDHFRGFESYWQVDYRADSAIEGQWRRGPGIKLFRQIKEELGQINIIVEDLGINTQGVDKLVRETGYPNMKVLQFAFNPDEESHHLPHRIEENTVVYTGTHDNPTAMEWLEIIGNEEFSHVQGYLGLDKSEGYNWGLIRGAWASRARMAIAPIQDFLGLGEEARMNRPGSREGNWTWRIKEENLRKELGQKILELTDLYKR